MTQDERQPGSRLREGDVLARAVAASTDGAGRFLVPSGDDLGAAAIPEGVILAGVDQLVDGRHVRMAAVGPEAAARKAIRRCVSDVAAMAGRPIASLVAGTLPPGLAPADVDRLVAGLHAEAERQGAPILGGDVALYGPESTDAPMVLSVTVLAVPGPLGPVRRSGARPGDRLWVTGRLGGSLAEDGVGGRHLDFAPRVPEALALADALGPRLHAMIDLSDGLGRDAGALAAASGVDLELDAAAIPARDGLDWRRAAGDGEDYELLFAAEGPVPDRLGDDVPVTCIGRVLAAGGDGAGTAWIREGDRRHAADAFGWEHRA